MANSDWISPNYSLTPPDQDNDDGSGSEDVVVTTAAANCTLPILLYRDYNVVTATICGLYFMFGVACTFFGYRCFKAVMFFTGFIFASIVVYLICLEEDVLPMWSNALIAVCAGILFGLITLLVQYVGLFMLGFHSGLLLGLVGLCVADQVAEAARPESPWTAVGVLIVSGLALALLNLCCQKSLTIFGSALYGGATVATCLDYFLEGSVMLLWVWDKVRVKKSPQPCWFSWVVLGVWPTCLALGMLTQILVTGKGTYHEAQFPPLNNRRRPKPESREDRRVKKYRYLYQVRTCHGDVISQPIPGKYVQHVNETHSA